MIEFGGIVVIGCALAMAAYGLVQQTLARPIALIHAALDAG